MLQEESIPRKKHKESEQSDRCQQGKQSVDEKYSRTMEGRHQNRKRQNSQVCSFFYFSDF